MRELTLLDLLTNDLVAALRLTVGEKAGPERAAVELLAEHRTWLTRADFGECVEIFHDPETEETGARILWDQVEDRLGQIDMADPLAGGAWTASASDLAVLRIAASLGGGYLVDLRAELARLSALNAAAVTDAVVCAARAGNQVLVTRSPEVARRHLD